MAFFVSAVPTVRSTQNSRPSSQRNQIPTQRGDAGRIDELNAQVSSP